MEKIIINENQARKLIFGKFFTGTWVRSKTPNEVIEANFDVTIVFFGPLLISCIGEIFLDFSKIDMLHISQRNFRG